MIKYCGADCEHNIPFPHKVIVGQTKSMIICTTCGHWIYRPMDRCNCRAGCHSEARYGLAEGLISG